MQLSREDHHAEVCHRHGSAAATAGHRASTCIRKLGDTVDVSRSFYSAKSCEEIKLANPNAP